MDPIADAILSVGLYLTPSKAVASSTSVDDSVIFLEEKSNAKTTITTKTASSTKLVFDDDDEKDNDLIKSINSRISELVNKNFNDNGSVDSNFNNSSVLSMTPKNRWQYKCEFCGKKFMRSDGLDFHKRAHHTGSKPFSCDICQQTFINQSQLQAHWHVHNANMFNCTFCSNGFTSITELTAHQLSHTPFVCVIGTCQERFSKKEDWEMHQRMMHGNQSFICSFCNENFPNKEELTSHELIHTPFACDIGICKERFTRKFDLKKHQRLQHGGQSLNCAFCRKCFANNEDLAAHESDHAAFYKPFACGNCPERFTKKVHLTAHHEQMHTNGLIDSLFSCATCGSTFDSKVYLNIHQRKHTGIRPFKCTDCGNTFICQQTLKFHRFTYCEVKDKL